MAIRIALLGTLGVEIDGVPIEAGLPGRQGRLLLAYLVLNRRRAVSRDELIDVLWPDQPPDAPDAVLSTVLSRLRRALGPDHLSGRSSLVLDLPADAWIDIEAAAQSADDAEADLAKGDAAQALRTRARRSTCSIRRCCPSSTPPGSRPIAAGSTRFGPSCSTPRRAPGWYSVAASWPRPSARPGG